MHNHYRIRRAISPEDAVKLRELFTTVFHPEEVGVLAETMFHHLPGMQNKYWFIAEEKKSGSIVAAFALIPWTWQWEGIPLKVAEMGIVGTLPEHRGRGLMHILNQEFDQTLADERFDLAVIQGIPGFYDQFGYQFAAPLENHINLPLHLIRDRETDALARFRLASLDDIPFLLAEDAKYRAAFSIAAIREADQWHYLLTHSRKTEYGSEFWIVENQVGAPQFYLRIPLDGFGDGLIVSEISEDIDFDTFELVMAFCKQKAVARDKPYIRLNLHNQSSAGEMAIRLGATEGKPYAWQIKIPHIPHFLTSITPLLEKRLQGSTFANFSGRFRLNFFRSQVDLVWDEGELSAVRPGAGAADYTFNTHVDHFVALCLGHRSWQEIRHVRPDIFPTNGKSALLLETLFPPRTAWIHEQY